MRALWLWNWNALRPLKTGPFPIPLSHRCNALTIGLQGPGPSTFAHICIDSRQVQIMPFLEKVVEV